MLHDLHVHKLIENYNLMHNVLKLGLQFRGITIALQEQLRRVMLYTVHNKHV